jgi:hypothetical protein
MLVQGGYIDKEIGLYSTIAYLFKPTFFVYGKAPTANFYAAFTAATSESSTRRPLFQRRAFNQGISRNANDLNALLSLNGNRFFKEKSLLKSLRESDWIPERIPDEELPIPSALSSFRLARAKFSLDPITGKKILENTPLVSRARAQGLPDETILSMHVLSALKDMEEEIPENLLPALPEGYTKGAAPGRARGDTQFSNSDLLTYLKLDLTSDVSGARPLSALNFTFITTLFMIHWELFEAELKRRRNPLYVLAYEEDPKTMREKRRSLTSLIMSQMDEECLELMAEVFTTPRYGAINHIYWEDLELPGQENPISESRDNEPACVVM